MNKTLRQIDDTDVYNSHDFCQPLSLTETGFVSNNFQS